MADMIMQLKVAPEDGEVEYAVLEEQVKKVVTEYDEALEVRSVEPVNMGFGLQAVRINFKFNEELGSDDLEDKLNELDVVGGVEVELMDRL